MAITPIQINENTVTKVATNVLSGTINRHYSVGRQMTWLVTYRLTGESAPTDGDFIKEGVRMFNDHPEQEIISNDAAIDIYVKCSDGGQDGAIGKLVVWT